MSHAQFCCSVCGLFTPGELSSSPIEAVADHYNIFGLFGGFFLCHCYQSVLAYIVYADICVVDNMVYMGAVCYSNRIPGMYSVHQQ